MEANLKGNERKKKKPFSETLWGFTKKMTYWRWLLLCPHRELWNTESPLQPTKAESLEERQLLRFTKTLSALLERCLSLAPLQMGPVVSLPALITFTSWQTKASWSCQIVLDTLFRQLSILSRLYRRFPYGSFWVLSTVKCTSGLRFRRGVQYLLMWSYKKKKKKKGIIKVNMLFKSWGHAENPLLWVFIMCPKLCSS